MARHIGIVACSAEGAALCYRTVCLEGAMLLGLYRHPELSLHNHCLADFMEPVEAGDWNAVGDLMLSSAHKLAAAGADFLICPDNTIHQAFDYVEPRSPLPWLHIAEVVAEAASSRGFRNVGLTGTRWLVESDVYRQKLGDRGLGYLAPPADDRIEVNRIIFEELVYGIFRPASAERMQAVVQRLKAAGADSVVLGCTEIPLMIDDANSPLPTLDSTRLLARAAVRHAISQP